MGEVAKPGFDVDLAFGEERETAFVQALRSCHVECKSDQKARVTGRLFVEFRQGSTERGYGRHSGIASSDAEWWAFEVFDDRWLVVRTSLLRALARRAKQEFGSVMGGDGGRYEGVLVPISWLVQPLTAQPFPEAPPGH